MLFDPFGKNGYTYFNELEINGEKTDDEENQNDYSAEEPEDDQTDIDTQDDPPVEDDITDYTEVDGDDGTDDEPEPQAAEDNTEPTVEDTPEEPTENDTATEEEPEAETPEDDTVTDDTDTGNVDTAGGDGNDGVSDDVTDYTEEDSDDGTDDETADDTTETEDNPDNTEDDTISDDNTEADTGDSSDGAGTLQDMEKTLFSDLSPQQMAIKNSELLQNYIDLFESLNTIFDNINKIPKTYSNTRVIEFVGEKLVEMKDMVNYIITTTYITKTYVENMATYKQCLLMLQQINTMLKGLVQKPIK